MSVRRTARAVLVCTVLVGVSMGLASCSGEPQSGADPTVSGPADEDTAMPLPEERAEGVPEECFAVYPWATGPADINSLELLPDGWPEAPDGSTLCTVNTGGGTETAAFVTELPAEEVLAHYEQALAMHSPTRVSGEDNGTGYASLDGVIGEALSFQIREAEGGFMFALVDNNAALE